MAMTLLVAATLLGAGVLSRRRHPGARRPPYSPAHPTLLVPATAVLDARFARGELAEDEYLRCRIAATADERAERAEQTAATASGPDVTGRDAQLVG